MRDKFKISTEVPNHEKEMHCGVNEQIHNWKDTDEVLYAFRY